MELKAHNVVKIAVEKNLELKRRFVEVYEVYQANKDNGFVVLRLQSVEQEIIEPCPHCGRWYCADEEVNDEGGGLV